MNNDMRLTTTTATTLVLTGTVWASALVLLVARVATVSGQFPDGGTPPSCSWMNTVLEGCSDDSFEFKDILGWDLLKRDYFACLYSRIIQADSRKTCQDDALLSQVQDCRVDAYMKLRPDVKLKSPPFDNSVQLFKNCMANTLGKFREAGMSSLRGFRVGTDVGPLQFEAKPNITVEYARFAHLMLTAVCHLYSRKKTHFLCK